MLRACKFCGRVHDSKIVCNKVVKRVKNKTKKDNFRSTAQWSRKSIEIRMRDRYLCQACLHNIEGTRRVIEHDLIEVHHIEPLEEEYELRLVNSNLISLCATHHKMADKGLIGKETLKEWAHENESIPPGLHDQKKKND